MMDEGKKMHGVFFLLEMQNMGLISGPSAWKLETLRHILCFRPYGWFYYSALERCDQFFEAAAPLCLIHSGPRFDNNEDKPHQKDTPEGREVSVIDKAILECRAQVEASGVHFKSQLFTRPLRNLVLAICSILEPWNPVWSCVIITSCIAPKEATALSTVSRVSVWLSVRLCRFPWDIVRYIFSLFLRCENGSLLFGLVLTFFIRYWIQSGDSILWKTTVILIVCHTHRNRFNIHSTVDVSSAFFFCESTEYRL
jgi:hypothetical protein